MDGPKRPPLLPPGPAEPERDSVYLPPALGLPYHRTLEEVLERRSFGPSLSQDLLATLLYHANEEARSQCLVAETVDRERFRAPETFFFAHAVDGLAPGLYRYDLRRHRATLLREGSFREEARRLCAGHDAPGDAPVTFLVGATWHQSLPHPRAYRTLLDVVHRYILLATAFELATSATPALHHRFADELEAASGLKLGTLYVCAVG